MTDGLDITFRTLAASPHEAAGAVLVPALASADPRIVSRAAETLIARPQTSGRIEVLRNWSRFDSDLRRTLAEHRAGLSKTIGDVLAGGDLQLAESAAEAALDVEDFDQLPLLARLAQVAEESRADLVLRTLLPLAERLFDRASGPRDYNDRRDFARLRANAADALGPAVVGFFAHGSPAVLDAFLCLAGRENSTLRRTLTEPDDPVHRIVCDRLESSALRGAIALLTSFLFEDPFAPPAVLDVIGRRHDRPFLAEITRRLSLDQTPIASSNLRRLQRIEWLGDQSDLIDELNDTEQAGALRLAAASGMDRGAVLDVVERVLKQGNAGGRRAASQLLASFDDPRATTLLSHALADDDPKVQASVVSQLRARNVAGAMGTVIAMLDSRYEEVRQAARESLREFSFDRYLHTFDSLTEEARRATGSLVKKADPRALELLAEELAANSRTRRLRALAMVGAMEAALSVVPSLLEVLSDRDHLVRAAAVAALGSCPTKAAMEGIKNARFDRSVVVREAAENSLARLAALVRQQASGATQSGKSYVVAEPPRTYVLGETPASLTETGGAVEAAP